MTKAIHIQRDINDGGGSIAWSPPLDEVFRAQLSVGVLSVEQTQPLNCGQSVIIERLVRGRVPDVLGLSKGPFVLAPALREFLDEKEPGAHRFFPIAVRTLKPVNGKEEHGTHCCYIRQPELTVSISIAQHSSLTFGARTGRENEGEPTHGEEVCQALWARAGIPRATSQ
jgi:hypothetical protein